MTDTNRDFTNPPTTGAQINERCAMVIGPPVTLEYWRAKAEAPPGPGVQALMNLISEDCVETTTEHIDSNTLVQKICIKDTDRVAQMARDSMYHADAMDGSGQLNGRTWNQVRDEEFARLVAEDCAKVAQSTVCDTHLPTGVRIYGTRAAKAIRARYSTSLATPPGDA